MSTFLIPLRIHGDLGNWEKGICQYSKPRLLESCHRHRHFQLKKKKKEGKRKKPTFLDIVVKDKKRQRKWTIRSPITCGWIPKYSLGMGKWPSEKCWPLWPVRARGGGGMVSQGLHHSAAKQNQTWDEDHTSKVWPGSVKFSRGYEDPVQFIRLAYFSRQNTQCTHLNRALSVLIDFAVSAYLAVRNVVLLPLSFYQHTISL